jgi:hypothetical protein
MVAGNKTIAWPQDSTYVDVNREEELEFWSKVFQVSRAMLSRAVRLVGPKYKDVSAYLDKKRQS